MSTEGKFAKTLYVGKKGEPQFIEFPAHETLEHAIMKSRAINRNGLVRVAEYQLVRVIEAKMVPKIICEIGE